MTTSIWSDELEGGMIAELIERARAEARRTLTQVLPDDPDYGRHVPIEYRLNAKAIVGVIAADLSDGKSLHAIVDGLHWGITTLEMFAEGSTFVAGLAIPGAVLSAAAPWLAIGAGYQEAAEATASKWAATGFSRGAVMGANGRSPRKLAEFFGDRDVVSTPGFEQNRAVARANYRVGLVAGYVQGRALSPNRLAIFWHDLGRRMDDQSYRGPSETWSRKTWIDWYSEAAGVFSRYHLVHGGGGGASELAPATTSLVSPLALGDGSLRRGRVRKLPVHGLCVHTTGGGSARAATPRRTPLQIALRYYVHGREGFPHYLIDYDGTIHAICDEGHIAWHAGWGTRGGRRRWATWTAPVWWRSVWQPRNIATPADLMPAQATDPNAVYIGVELLADKSGWGFTNAQYAALARLTADVFTRHAIPLAEPPNTRLLGHEDLEPVARAQADGGWDPGAHRRNPKFSWAALWSRIQAGGPTGSAGG